MRIRHLFFTVTLVSFGILTWAFRPIENTIIHDNESPCKQIVLSMFDAIRNVKTLRYELKATERVDGKLNSAISEVKLNVSPRELYFKNLKKGYEILWKAGWNDGDALISPNSFPYFDLSLDPMGSLMRHNQHHTLNQLGYAFTGNIIAQAVLKDPKNFDKHFLYQGEVTWNNILCDKIDIEFPDFHYFNYVSKKGETLESIANKFDVNDFMIREKNGLSSYYSTLKAGTKLLVPSNYGKSTIIYVDRARHVPVFVQVYDDKGLYEQYEFLNLKINTPIPEDEFSKDYKDYNF